jgi:GNAT superfamily N-acetyltransferase
MIEELVEQPGQEIVELFTASYLNVPLHLVLFPGDEEMRRKEIHGLFSMAFSKMLTGGTWLVVREGSAFVGMLRYTRSPDCMASQGVLAELAPVMKEALGKTGELVVEWLRKWADVHPDNDHWHLGPFAVMPECQGQGMGRLLMDEYCRRMDEARAVGYLETDVPQIVPFYEECGFSVIREAQVLGIKNWFMERNPRETE